MHFIGKWVRSRYSALAKLTQGMIWIQFGYDLRTSNDILGNVNIGYGLAVACTSWKSEFTITQLREIISWTNVGFSNTAYFTSVAITGFRNNIILNSVCTFRCQKDKLRQPASLVASNFTFKKLYRIISEYQECLEHSFLHWVRHFCWSMFQNWTHKPVITIHLFTTGGIFIIQFL